MIQLILLIGTLLFAVYAAQRFLNTAPAARNRKFRRGLLWFGGLLLLLLAATGRLGLLLPLIGALIATLLRLLPLLIQVVAQYIPVWQRARQQQQSTQQRTAGGDTDKSTVESGFLRMQLDHATGEIAGEVLKGRHAGRLLSELNPEQLADLYEEYTRKDRESATLLRAYLDRVYGETWEDRREARSEPPSGGKMTPDEAYRILGLERGATRDDIVGAHRRLMQRLHPDRGGSDYLAAKINQAKDLLLGR